VPGFSKNLPHFSPCISKYPPAIHLVSTWCHVVVLSSYLIKKLAFFNEKLLPALRVESV
jgi:hypothetical protein